MNIRKAVDDLLIPDEVCTRCGACFAADSNNTLKKNSNGFPRFQKDTESSEVERLLKVCTGSNWNYRALLDFVHGSDYHYDPSEISKGKLIRLGIGQSKKSHFIKNGQSGGVSISIIAAALETGMIDAFLAVRRPTDDSPKNPFSAEPFIVTSIDQLEEASGSKYTVCSSLEILPSLAASTPQYAASLLPCQSAGLRQLQKEGYFDRDRCKLVIGPFCGYTMEPEVGEDLSSAMGINSSEVIKFGNRNGDFPGKTTFTAKDNTTHTLDRTAHRALYRAYTPERCFTCTDFTNELADISIADCWNRNDSGEYDYPSGAAWILVRTKRGLDFLNNAINSGYLNFQETSESENDHNWTESIIYRKIRAFNRIHLRENEGSPTPHHDFPIPEFNPIYSKADRTEYRIINALQIRWLKRWFIRWWVRLFLNDEAFSVRTRKYLGTRLFTHHRDLDSILKATTKVSAFYIRYKLFKLISSFPLRIPKKKASRK